MKTCTLCGQLKELDQFPKNKQFKSGYNSRCKSCMNSVNKTYRSKNPKQFSNMRKQYYQKNIDKMRSDKREYYREHTEQKKLYDISYRELNRDKIRQYKKSWEALHKNDPIFKIKRNLRRRINHLVNGRKSASTFDLIGCTAEEFKLHIESKFTDGMSWDNYGPKGWHIDHIIPCYKFDLTKPEEQRKCFHYSNQRPLWAKDNLSRRKIYHPPPTISDDTQGPSLYKQ